MTRHRRPRSRRTLAGLTALGVTAGVVVGVPMVAQASTTFTVTNTDESSLTTGSLAWAILQANGTLGADTIDFNLPSGSTTITLTTAFSGIQVLPQITDGLTIDATSNPGGPVEIVAAAPFASGRLFWVSGNNVTIRGLTIAGTGSGYVSYPVLIAPGVTGTTVDQNQFGVDVSGNVAAGGQIAAAVYAATNVGGPASAVTVSNNLIANASSGVVFDGTTGSTITGNTVGLSADGTAALPLTTGLELHGVSHVTIDQNVVAGPPSGNAGIYVDGGDTVTITGNHVGTRSDGTGQFPGRAAGGIVVSSASAPVSTLYVAANTASHGSGDGVVLSGGTNGIGGTVTSNLITDNSGSGIRATGSVPDRLELGGNDISGNGLLGIDTGPVFPNAAPDGPPTITSAVDGSDQLGLTYDGPAGPQDATVFVSTNTTCPSLPAYPQGEHAFATSSSIPLDANGDFAGDVTLNVPLTAGQNITALITPTTGISTEYSSCFTVTAGGSNSTPSASSGSVTTSKDVPLGIQLQGTDADPGTTLSFTPDQTTAAGGTVSGPTGVSCTGAGPVTCTQTWGYTPPAGYTGPDSFTYTVTDGTATSAAATVSITVSDVQADLQVGPLVDTPDPVTGGGLVQYTTTVTNSGPDAATSVDVTLFGDSSSSLPAFTTFVSGTAGSATCTSTSGGAVHCPIGTLASGASIPVSIVLRADAVTSTTSVPVNVAVSGTTTDPNGSNDSSTTMTTINPAAPDQTTTYVPPSTTSTTVSDAPTTTVNNEPVPIASSTDTTAALVVVPGGGPGGTFSVVENACTGLLFCASNLLNSRVITFAPPQTSAAIVYYTWQHPLRYTLTYDRTTVGGISTKNARVRYEKDSNLGTLLTANKCPRTLTASTVFPCVRSIKLLKSKNAAVNGDLQVLLFATANDPKIGTYK